MFRRWKKHDIVIAEPVDAAESVDSPEAPLAPFDNLPYIDNDTLDQFLADRDSVELLPVDPSDFRRELQRLIVSAFLHEASTQAKCVEPA
jgi:hypothetical protein